MVTLTLNGALEEAGRLEQSGHAVKAAKLYRTVLKSFPRNTPALAGLSRVTASITPRGKRLAPDKVRKRLEQALGTSTPDHFLGLVAAALTEYPACPLLWNLRGYGQQRRNLMDEAKQSFQRSIALGPRYPDAYSNLGHLLSLMGDIPGAVETLQEGLQVNPNYTSTLLNLAALKSELGEVDVAQNLYERALQIVPNHSGAHRQLADLRKYTADDPHIAQMQQVIQNAALRPKAKSEVHFALSKALGDLQDWEGSAYHLKQGNALRKELIGFDIEADSKHFARIKEMDAALGDTKVDRVMVKLRPLFLLGMPRSGTTLVEQILAAHPQVAAAGELPFLGKLMQQEMAQNGPYNSDFLKRVRQAYFEKITPLAQSGGADKIRMITDKMPHNFRWVGVIARAFPEAKIVHIHRDPRAVAWSNFKHFFVEQTGTLNYSWDLNDIAEHHALYRELMGHWHKTHPGRILDFDYEQLTREQEPQTRALIDWLGLPWDDACLEPHKVKREVRTSSMQQVRKKVYQGSSKEWEKVAPYLGEAFANLPTTALTYKDQD